MGRQLIHVGSVFTVERHESADSIPVLLKYPTAMNPPSSVLTRLEREYEIGTTLHLPGIRKVLRRTNWDGRPALELEFVAGDDFKTFFKMEEHRQCEIVLPIALSALRALAALHAEGVIHHDIASTNFLVSTGTEDAVLIDLEFASRGVVDGFSAARGQFPYLSPEQTGRIELPVDERSDLYAFGVVLYEMLTGELPFFGEDYADWIHAHLACLPEAPSSRVQTVPEVLSEIVMRLLAKEPINRYQTARGLCRDIERCLNDLRSNGIVSPFSIGREDHSGRVHFLSVLYGREDEQQQLQTALERAIAGEPSLQCISGFAGSGKTALVHELRFPVAIAKGRFISGKFDQTLQALPYAAFADAFTQLCHQLLAESPEEVAAFRSRVLETLGSNAGLLLDFVPILKSLIGPQPLPPEIETMESANRFAVALLGFFHCMVSEEHPLVLFLDDLQWADAASLELLYMIVTRSVRSHFLILCAYRGAELTAEHPLSTLLEKLCDAPRPVGRMVLGGLNVESTAAMLAAAMDMPIGDVGSLAGLLHEKTDGNPFFLRQLIEALVSEEVLLFDQAKGAWRWDTEQVKALNISDNVIELMLRKIARLPEETREALRAAACIGNNFSMDLLSVTITGHQTQLWTLLAPAFDAGLIARTSGGIRFTHDRIQEALYQALSPERTQQYHLVLGRYLLRQPQQTLAAVRHLNAGIPQIDSEEERVRLAALNLEAGDAYRASMAYVSALDVYTVGRNLLAGVESGNGELLFKLRFHQAETIFLVGDGAKALCELEEILQDAASVSARTRAHQLLIGIHTAKLQVNEAMLVGKQALAELGLTLPDIASLDRLQERIDEIDDVVSKKDIADWPVLHDDDELVILGLLTHLVPPAYIGGAPEFAAISIEFARRSLLSGLSPFSSFALSVYGMLLAVGMQRYESAYRIGALAAEIARRPDNFALRARTNFFHAVFILHWNAPLEASLPFLDEGWRSGVESGDLQFASYCINHIHGNSLLSGQSLPELEESLARFSNTNALIGQEDGQHFFALLRRAIARLRKSQERLPEPEYDESAIVDVWRSAGNLTMLSFHHILHCFLALILERPVEALAEAEEAVGSLAGMKGMTWVPHHSFFLGLTLADAIRDDRQERTALSRISEQCDVLRGLAEHSPNNYRSKFLLLEAELADLTGEDLGALLNAYDIAIDAAAQADRILDRAMACERAAACWLRREKPQLAGLYLQRAVFDYESWGAGIKVAQLMRDYSSLIVPLRPRDSQTGSSSSGDGLHSVDVFSVLKAAQTVAGELVMDRMLARLIGLVIETAGAQSGFLLLEQNGDWRVVAAQHPGNPNVEVLQWRPLTNYPEIAAGVVQYVTRTRKTVNLDDAVKSTLFAADSSLAKRRCKSLLCLPIINRGELGGILYLENNLATHAFSRTQTQILQLLTTQAISSLEISRYFARMQTLNRSLEEEIEERKRTESQLEFLANHDSLTGLPNRRLLFDRVKYSITRAQANGNRVAVMFLDLDQFKNINDTLSHQVGDRLLQGVAQRLAAQVRAEDTLGRLGGDEFVVLMEGELDLQMLSALAQKLLSIFASPINVAGHDLYPTGSLGISLYPDDASDADQLLRNADAAMYQAKQQGRNGYRFFSARLAEAAAERLTLEQDLRRAVVAGEFELYYQPQVSLENGRITGAEALLRWNHPKRGLLGPDQFISVAEESGTIVSIGEWVLRHACAQLEQWNSEGIHLGRVAVNVSGNQFGLHSRFADLVKRILDESSIRPENLELELTESVLLQDAEFAMRSLEQLNALGIRLAIDDFGTGYSSLSYLHRLPVGRLKIDRSFIDGLPAAKDSAMIVESIMLLGRNLGKELIAEGIETEEQQRFLLAIGCTEGQGYRFGQPLPLAAFNRLLFEQGTA